MKVYDIFSRLPAWEIGLEKLEQIFENHRNGLKCDPFDVIYEVPDHAPENIHACRGELLREGR